MFAFNALALLVDIRKLQATANPGTGNWLHVPRVDRL